MLLLSHRKNQWSEYYISFSPLSGKNQWSLEKIFQRLKGPRRVFLLLPKFDPDIKYARERRAYYENADSRVDKIQTQDTQRQNSVPSAIANDVFENDRKSRLARSCIFGKDQFRVCNARYVLEQFAFSFDVNFLLM